MSIKDTIVCDLDGTLANCEHRVHHVQKVDSEGEKRKPDWNAFYAGIKDDEVHEAVHSVLFSRQPEMNVIFSSGRPERCRADTVWWLTNKTAVRNYTLLMRKDGDNRADYIVKQEMLDVHIPKDRVSFVMDDRQQVVSMWRRNGLMCFQVAEGNF
jgi:hypothetical protein